MMQNVTLIFKNNCLWSQATMTFKNIRLTEGGGAQYQLRTDGDSKKNQERKGEMRED